MKRAPPCPHRQDTAEEIMAELRSKWQEISIRLAVPGVLLTALGGGAFGNHVLERLARDEVKTEANASRIAELPSQWQREDVWLKEAVGEIKSMLRSMESRMSQLERRSGD